jgi:hypothetical protein
MHIKYFKTAFIGMVFLGAFSAVLTSCSSDDNESESTEQPTDGRKLRQLTITDVPITRAMLTDNTTSLGATWSAGDEATYFNLSSYNSTVMHFGTLISSKEATKSTFTGTVQCDQGEKIALFYPATDPFTSGSDRGTFAINLSGQKGTLEDVANNYHYIYGVGEITSVTDNTANATIASTKSLLAVCKFTFKDKDTNADIPVKELTIGYGNYKYPLSGTVNPFDNASSVVANPAAPNTWTIPLTVTLVNEKVDGVVYVALFPCGNASREEFHFTVTGSAGTYTGTATAKLNAGKFYPVTLNLTKQIIKNQ